MPSYYNKGIVLSKIGKYQEAIKNYNLAIKHNPNIAESYLEKGITLFKLRKFKEAKENFNLALKYNSNLITGYEKGIKLLRKLDNNIMADDFEEKLRILKDNL